MHKKNELLLRVFGTTCRTECYEDSKAHTCMTSCTITHRHHVLSLIDIVKGIEPTLIKSEHRI